MSKNFESNEFKYLLNILFLYLRFILSQKNFLCLNFRCFKLEFWWNFVEIFQFSFSFFSSKNEVTCHSRTLISFSDENEKKFFADWFPGSPISGIPPEPQFGEVAGHCLTIQQGFGLSMFRPHAFWTANSPFWASQDCLDTHGYICKSPKPRKKFKPEIETSTMRSKFFLFFAWQRFKLIAENNLIQIDFFNQFDRWKFIFWLHLFIHFLEIFSWTFSHNWASIRKQNRLKSKRGHNSERLSGISIPESFPFPFQNRRSTGHSHFDKIQRHRRRISIGMFVRFHRNENVGRRNSEKILRFFFGGGSRIYFNCESGNCWISFGFQHHWSRIFVDLGSDQHFRLYCWNEFSLRDRPKRKFSQFLFKFDGLFGDSENFDRTSNFHRFYLFWRRRFDGRLPEYGLCHNFFGRFRQIPIREIVRNFEPKLDNDEFRLCQLL